MYVYTYIYIHTLILRHVTCRQPNNDSHTATLLARPQQRPAPPGRLQSGKPTWTRTPFLLNASFE